MGKIKMWLTNFQAKVNVNRKILLSLLISVIGIIILAVYFTNKSGEEEESLLSRQREYTVVRGNITVGVEGSGKLEATRILHTFSKDLIFEKYNVKPGDMVRKGDALAEISKEGMEKVVEELKLEADNAKSALQEAINSKSIRILQSEKEAKTARNTSQSAYENSFRQISDQIASLEERLGALDAPNISAEEARRNADEAASALEEAERNLALASGRLESAIAAQSQYEGDDPVKQAALQEEVDNAQQEVNSLTEYRDSMSRNSREASRIREAAESARGIREQLSEAEKSLEALKDSRARELGMERGNEAMDNKLDALQVKSLQEAVDKAQNAYDMAKKKLETTEALMENPVLYAETDGVVLAAPYLKGEKITPEKAAVEIGDLSKMLFKPGIEPADIHEIKEGQEVRITVDIFPSQEIKGKVISKTLTPNEGVYAATIEIEPNELPLLEGMDASATIISKEKENVLVLSNKAIILKDGKQYVKLQNKDESAKEAVKEAEITTGFSDGNVTEVLSGLSENDIVIVEE